MFDHHRVQQDFLTLKAFLNHSRSAAIETSQKIIIRFHPNQAALHQFDGNLISTLPVPTIHQVNYDTTLGKNMIVFSPTNS